jgi:glycosyltransferase involved in cell wall biosynthesis
VAVGSGDYEVNYRAETQHRKMVADRVTFVESVRDVVPILAQLDVVVMPSLWEACGLLAIEAMCMGVPLIGSDCIGLREVLRGTPSRMVATNNAATLANALREAMRNPWTDEACAYAPTARNRFDVTIAAKALLSHFDELATRKRKKHIALTRLFAN